MYMHSRWLPTVIVVFELPSLSAAHLLGCHRVKGPEGQKDSGMHYDSSIAAGIRGIYHFSLPHATRLSR